MEIMFKNLMEDILIKRLDELLPSLNCCKCEKCRMDIVTYALNRLEPKYVVTTQGELLSKIDTLSIQNETNVIIKITEAAMIVKNSPRHLLTV